MRAVAEFAAGRRPRARGLQRLPGADRGGAAARRADAQRRPEVRLRRRSALTVATADSAFTRGYARGETVRLPDRPPRRQLRRRRRDAARGWRARTGWRSATSRTPTARAADIAGVLSANRRVLGLMPHPERAVDPALGGHRRRPAVRGAGRRAGAGPSARRLSEPWSRRSVGPMSQAGTAPRPIAHPGRLWMRVGLLASDRRHGAGDLGQPPLPDALVQRGPERRRDGARDALRRLDPEHDAAALGGAAAARRATRS